MTREAFEAALDRGTLETRVTDRSGDRWYRVRRNGRTKTWKRDPSRFIIPIKFRLRDTMQAQDRHFHNGEIDKWFRIRAEPEED